MTLTDAFSFPLFISSESTVIAAEPAAEWAREATYHILPRLQRHQRRGSVRADLRRAASVALLCAGRCRGYDGAAARARRHQRRAGQYVLRRGHRRLGLLDGLLAAHWQRHHAAPQACQLRGEHHGGDRAGNPDPAHVDLHGADGRRVAVEAGVDGGHGGVSVFASER